MLVTDNVIEASQEVHTFKLFGSQVLQFDDFTQDIQKDKLFLS